MKSNDTKIKGINMVAIKHKTKGETKHGHQL